LIFCISSPDFNDQQSRFDCWIYFDVSFEGIFEPLSGCISPSLFARMHFAISSRSYSIRSQILEACVFNLMGTQRRIDECASVPLRIASDGFCEGLSLQQYFILASMMTSPTFVLIIRSTMTYKRNKHGSVAVRHIRNHGKCSR
jgi:hypothetical protein